MSLVLCHFGAMHKDRRRGHKIEVKEVNLRESYLLVTCLICYSRHLDLLWRSTGVTNNAISGLALCLPENHASSE